VDFHTEVWLAYAVEVAGRTLLTSSRSDRTVRL
jgi:hypothetical protein